MSKAINGEERSFLCVSWILGLFTLEQICNKHSAAEYILNLITQKTSKKSQNMLLLTTFGYTLKQTITLFTQLCWEGKTTAVEQHKTEQSSKQSEEWKILNH